jgi:hypothetical protein
MKKALREQCFFSLNPPLAEEIIRAKTCGSDSQGFHRAQHDFV